MAKPALDGNVDLRTFCARGLQHVWEQYTDLAELSCTGPACDRHAYRCSGLLKQPSADDAHHACCTSPHHLWGCPSCSQPHPGTWPRQLR